MAEPGHRDADVESLAQDIMVDDYYSSEKQVASGRAAIEALVRLCREARARAEAAERRERELREAASDFLLECEISMSQREAFGKIAWILTGGQTSVDHQDWFNRIVKDLEALALASSAQEPGEGT